MSDSEESAVVSLSTRQWTLLEEHLDFHILNDFLGNELPSRKSDETEDGHRQQMRKLQVDQLKRVVNNDSTKLSLLRTAISSRQPDLAGSMNLDSAPTDSSSESSREQGGNKVVDIEDVSVALALRQVPSTESYQGVSDSRDRQLSIASSSLDGADNSLEVICEEQDSDSTTSDQVSEVSCMSPTAESKNQSQVLTEIPGHPIQSSDSKLKTFYDLMIGSQTERENDESLLIVETNSFSSDALLDCYRRCKISDSGLASVLKPYLVDFLKRQQSLDAISSLKELKGSNKLQVKKEMPSSYFSYKHKDLFIALLEVTPSHSHSKLMNLCTRLNRPVPFLYRQILSNGNFGFKLADDGKDKLVDGSSWAERPPKRLVFRN
ncbi:uncharacterized protein LOC134193533 [Corticium candelabrum]|uniref:uncharacterized protein LOC134193533 n=1 Tax=Corticium candelabrum TaxID=121492 RepID=UPI002E261059|nr:uncharacterized protein LOC134193533 [Corticium candelabrum]